MINLLITILILVLIAGITVWAIGLLPLPAPWNRAAQGLVAIIFVLVLLGMLLNSGDLSLRLPH